jgi:hypothetical protein
MPLSVPLTEELVHNWAPDEATWTKAQAIAQGSALSNLGVSADGTWLLGDAQGSGTTPYILSADFVDPASPEFRSTSPARKKPDKYTLALLLAYIQRPEAFGTREPTDDLILKREKKVAAEERRLKGPNAKKQPSKAAMDKKMAAQHDGLELLEKLLVDLVAAGQWFEASRLEKMERQAKQLADAYLPAPMYTLRRLMLLGKQKGIGDDERMAVGADLIGQLWATVQRGKAYLAGRLAGDSQVEYDALVEDILGKTWQLHELKEKGYYRENITLLELAYERLDDDARQQRIETSNVIDLQTGEILQTIAYRPYKGLNQIPEQPSYTAPLTVAEAGVYPGFINRRVRWEKNTEVIGRGTSEAIENAYHMAKPDFTTVIDEFRAQLKHPLAPREAVFLLQCQRVGRVGERVTVLEDANGVRIEAADKRKDYSNVSNLVRAAGMLGKDQPAVLVRLFLQPLTNNIVALPLAAITTKHHLRLGL